MNSQQEDVFNNSSKKVVEVKTQLSFYLLSYIVSIERLQWYYLRLWTNWY